MQITQVVLAASILAATSSVSARSINSNFPEVRNEPPNRTRAEVIAELRASQADGTYVVGGIEFDAHTIGSASNRSRAEVIAELEQAKADGSYARMHREYLDRNWEYHANEEITRVANSSGGGSQN